MQSEIKTLQTKGWKILGKEVEKHLSDFRKKYSGLKVEWDITWESINTPGMAQLFMKASHEDKPEESTQSLLFPPDSCC